MFVRFHTLCVILEIESGTSFMWLWCSNQEPMWQYNTCIVTVWPSVIFILPVQSYKRHATMKQSSDTEGQNSETHFMYVTHYSLGSKAQLSFKASIQRTKESVLCVSRANEESPRCVSMLRGLNSQSLSQLWDNIMSVCKNPFCPVWEQTVGMTYVNCTVVVTMLYLYCMSVSLWL